MSFNYDEVNPSNDHNPEDFTQSIESFNKFLEVFDEVIESQSFESDKEELEELKDSMSDTVEVYGNSRSFGVTFKDSNKLKIYKFHNLEVSSVEFRDGDLEIRAKMTGEL